MTQTKYACPWLFQGLNRLVLCLLTNQPTRAPTHPSVEDTGINHLTCFYKLKERISPISYHSNIRKENECKVYISQLASKTINIQCYSIPGRTMGRRGKQEGKYFRMSSKQFCYSLTPHPWRAYFIFSSSTHL